MHVTQDPASWKAGYASGFAGELAALPQASVTDKLAWTSGRIEGLADLEFGRPSRLNVTAPPRAGEDDASLHLKPR